MSQRRYFGRATFALAHEYDRSLFVGPSDESQASLLTPGGGSCDRAQSHRLPPVLSGRRKHSCLWLEWLSGYRERRWRGAQLDGDQERYLAQGLAEDRNRAVQA